MSQQWYIIVVFWFCQFFRPLEVSPCPLCHSQIRLPIFPKSPSRLSKTSREKPSNIRRVLVRANWGTVYKAVHALEILTTASCPAPQLLTIPSSKPSLAFPQTLPPAAPTGNTMPWPSYPNWETNMDTRLLTQLRTSFRFPDRCPFSVLESRPGLHVGLTCHVSIVFSDLCQFLRLAFFPDLDTCEEHWSCIL